MHVCRLWQLSLSLCCILILVSLSPAQATKPGSTDPVLGRWDLTIEGPDGPYPSWLEIMLRKETELQGRIVGRFGSMRHLAQVEYRNNELTLRAPVQYEQNKSDLIFTGRLVGDRLEGTTQSADGQTLKWIGVRAPELKRSSPPKWGQPVELFNGKDLSGWKLRNNARGNCWVVEGGLLKNNTPCVDIISEQKFNDFKLHVEFNTTKDTNSGIYLRGRHEVQILDDVGRATDSLRMGGVYGFLKPAMNTTKSPGEWQAFDITLIGRRVTVILNGQTLISNEEIPGITGGALDSDEGAAGPIMLQGDHSKVVFRKVTITPAR